MSLFQRIPLIQPFPHLGKHSTSRTGTLPTSDNLHYDFKVVLARTDQHVMTLLDSLPRCLAPLLVLEQKFFLNLMVGRSERGNHCGHLDCASHSVCDDHEIGQTGIDLKC